MSNDTLQVFEGSLVPIVMEFQGLEGDIYIYASLSEKEPQVFEVFFSSLFLPEMELQVCACFLKVDACQGLKF